MATVSQLGDKVKLFLLEFVIIELLVFTENILNKKYCIQHMENCEKCAEVFSEMLKFRSKVS